MIKDILEAQLDHSLVMPHLARYLVSMVKVLLSGQPDLLTNTHLALTLSDFLSPIALLAQCLAPTLRDHLDLNVSALL